MGLKEVRSYLFLLVFLVGAVAAVVAKSINGDD